MNQETKLSIAMELIEKQIAKCMMKLHKTEDNIQLQKYHELLKTRDKIYKNDENEIEKIIKEAGK